jgi:hypothetical protein
MDMYEYNRLSLGERASLLWQEGTHLDRFTDDHSTTNLYFINNFYIEAVVSHKSNRIIDVTSFKNGDQLEKYLVGLHLHDLM